MKRTLSPVENNKVRLRLLGEADLLLTMNWRNQDHIRRWFFHSDPINLDQHKKWFDDYRQRDDDFVFIAEDVLNDCKPFGQVALYDIDWAARCGEFGRVFIGEAFARGRGLGYEMTGLAIQIAFNSLGLDNLFLEVFVNNVAARKVYLKAGFVDQSQKDKVLTMRINRNWL